MVRYQGAMPRDITLPLANRLALCRADVTLDGAPAAICGALHGFATVVGLPDGPRGEWDWKTAQDIVASGGEFDLRGRHRLANSH